METSVKVKYETLRSIAFGDIGIGYSKVGTKLDYPSHLIKIYNLTDADVFVSHNGVDNHYLITANSAEIVDYSANKANSDRYVVEAGTAFHLKRISGAPTTGSVYLATCYGG